MFISKSLLIKVGLFLFCSHSYSISEADSGVDGLFGPSSSASNVSTPASSGKRFAPVENLPRLDARKGAGFASPKIDTPSKRTKKTDKAKLLRTVRKIEVLCKINANFHTIFV